MPGRRWHVRNGEGQAEMAMPALAGANGANVSAPVATDAIHIND
jgi:hypothetical protein